GKYAAIQDAFIAVFPPPPVQGLGTIGGFKMMIEDRAALGYDALFDATNAFTTKARATPELAGIFTNYQVNVPQLDVKLDRVKAK
ncbi:efflux RND transporter permease subunit, partial [Cupriavidus sp. CV2]